MLFEDGDWHNANQIMQEIQEAVTIINYANNQSQTVKKKIRTENQEQSLKAGQRKYLKNLQIVLFILKIKKIEALDQDLSLIIKV